MKIDYELIKEMNLKGKMFNDRKIMNEYTAIYSSEKLKNIEYFFKAENLKGARQFCKRKFAIGLKISLRDESTGKLVSSFINK